MEIPTLEAYAHDAMIPVSTTIIVLNGSKLNNGYNWMPNSIPPVNFIFNHVAIENYDSELLFLVSVTNDSLSMPP